MAAAVVWPSTATTRWVCRPEDKQPGFGSSCLPNWGFVFSFRKCGCDSKVLKARWLRRLCDDKMAPRCFYKAEVVQFLSWRRPQRWLTFPFMLNFRRLAFASLRNEWLIKHASCLCAPVFSHLHNHWPHTWPCVGRPEWICSVLYWTLATEQIRGTNEAFRTEQIQGQRKNCGSGVGGRSVVRGIFCVSSWTFSTARSESDRTAAFVTLFWPKMEGLQAYGWSLALVCKQQPSSMLLFLFAACGRSCYCCKDNDQSPAEKYWFACWCAFVAISFLGRFPRICGQPSPLSHQCMYWRVNGSVWKILRSRDFSRGGPLDLQRAHKPLFFFLFRHTSVWNIAAVCV